MKIKHYFLPLLFLSTVSIQLISQEDLQIIVETPSALAGLIKEVGGPTTDFGGQLTRIQRVKGKLVLVDNGETGSAAQEACSPLANAGELRGNIALIRGGCFFSTNVYYAQQAGAIAAIIFNGNQGGPFTNMGSGGEFAGQAFIPSAHVSNQQGIQWVQALQEGEEINLTLRRPNLYDPTGPRYSIMPFEHREPLQLSISLSNNTGSRIESVTVAAVLEEPNGDLQYFSSINLGALFPSSLTSVFLTPNNYLPNQIGQYTLKFFSNASIDTIRVNFEVSACNFAYDNTKDLVGFRPNNFEQGKRYDLGNYYQTGESAAVAEAISFGIQNASELFNSTSSPPTIQVRLFDADPDRNDRLDNNFTYEGAFPLAETSYEVTGTEASDQLITVNLESPIVLPANGHYLAVIQYDATELSNPISPLFLHAGVQEYPQDFSTTVYTDRLYLAGWTSNNNALVRLHLAELQNAGDHIVDLGISEILSETSLCGQGELASCQVHIRNYGRQAQSNIPVVLESPEGQLDTTYLDQVTIGGGCQERLLLPVQKTLPIGESIWKMYTIYPQDEDPSNDTLLVRYQYNPSIAAGQISGPEAVTLRDTAVFTYSSELGQLQWQVSEEGLYWQDLPHVSSTLNTTFNIPGKKYLRVQQLIADCQDFFSDPFLVEVLARQGDSFSDPLLIEDFPFLDTLQTNLYSDQLGPFVYQPSADVFYRFTVPSCVDTMQFSLCQSNFDTQLSIFDEDRNRISRDLNGCGGGTSQLELVRTLVPGQEYFIMVEGTGVSEGTIILEVEAKNLNLELEDVSICPGESKIVTYEHLFATNYRWSTGDIGPEATISDTGLYTLSIDLENCTLTDTFTVKYFEELPLQGVIQLSTPADRAFDLPLGSIEFSYQPPEGALFYDIYVWESWLDRPSSPTVFQTPLINQTISGLRSGTAYKWQVVAKNNCYELESEIFDFSIIGLPDLIVSDLDAPSTVIAGTSLDVGWKVNNIGTATTGATTWRDYVYLSIDGQLRAPDDLRLTQVDNIKFLAMGESYQQQQSISLPPDLTGSFKLFIISDNLDAFARGGRRMRELDEFNNWQVQDITILPPPSPDLSPTSVGGPVVAFGGDEIQISYSVENKGDRSIQGSNWKDQVFLSPTPDWDPTTAISIAENAISGILSIDSSYTQQISGMIPLEVSGTYYIIIFADADDDIAEFSGGNNNYLSQPEPLEITLVPPADLAITSFEVPDRAVAGSALQVSWEVSNQGFNSPFVSNWVDRIYLSSLDFFDEDIAIPVSQVLLENGEDFLAGQGYSQVATFTVPEDLSGNYYLYIYTDANDEIFESSFETNNLRRTSEPILIEQFATADLVVAELTAPNEAYIGEFLSIDWRIKNSGADAADVLWTDAIFLQKEPTVNSETTNPLITRTAPVLLEADSSYIQSISVPIDQRFRPGEYYIIAQTDYQEEVFELDGETNNILSSGMTTLGKINLRLRESDLSIVSLEVPPTAFGGQTVQISWEVINLGEAAPSVFSWIDGLYFSSDEEWSSDDIRIKRVDQSIRLTTAESYQTTINVQLPDGFEGQYYIILRTDDRNQIENELNPVGNVESASIAMNLLPTPDLSVALLGIPDTVFSGQQIQVRLQVDNLAQESAIRRWKDGIFLSKTPFLNPSSEELKIQVQEAELVEGQVIDEFLSIQFPPYINGVYYLIAKTDINNQIFEQGLEENNEFSKFIQLITPEPADLIVKKINTPLTTYLGDSVIIGYTINNQGLNPAIGPLRSNSYFSENSNIEGSKLLNITDGYIELSPGDSVVQEVKGLVSELTPGNYQPIVLANAQQTVTETRLDNNLGQADSEINVLVREIQLGISEQAPLPLGRQLYYKVAVAPEQDMVIDLKSNQSEGINELFVAHEEIPGPTRFDFSHSEEATAYQLLVAQTRAGDSFLQVRTQSLFSEDQEVEITVNTLPFSILSAVPSTLGQGEVTHQIRGAGFRDGAAVELRSGEGEVVATGKIVNYISSMELLVRWQLQDVALGIYDLYVINPGGTSVSLEDGIRIEQATAYDVGIAELTPSLIRLGKSGDFTYIFENRSNIDIPLIRANYSIYGYPKIEDLQLSEGAYRISDLTQDSTDYLDYHLFRQIPVFAKDLRPGATFTVKFTLSDFGLGVVPISLRVETLSDEDFIKLQLGTAERVRQEALQRIKRENLQVRSDILFGLQNAQAFRDSVLRAYLLSPLLEAEDTAGFSIYCQDCFNYDYDLATVAPGSITYETDLNFKPGEKLYWEISHPNGQAGQSRGWDLIRTSGRLVFDPVERSNEEAPFTFTIASQSSFDHNPGFLSSWSPAYDECWPAVIAEGGIEGFDSSSITIDDQPFTFYNETFGGHFTVEAIGDTLFVCYHSPVGVVGIPGNPGQPGEAGGPGGPGGGSGGPGGPGIPPLPPPPDPFPPGSPNPPPSVPDPPNVPAPPGPGGPGGPGGGSGGPGGVGAPGSPGGPGGGGGQPGPQNPNPGPSGPPGEPGPNTPSPFNCGQIGEAAEICSYYFRIGGCIVAGAACIALVELPIVSPLLLNSCLLGGVNCITGSPISGGYACVPGDPLSCAELFCQAIPIVFPCDPNEITGPPGLGIERWVSDKYRMGYTIFFENDPELASSSAQTVDVRQKLDEDLDPFSFQLGKFGFGAFNFTPPDNAVSYTTVLDTYDSLGVDVQFSAGIDLEKKEIFWNMRAIDPITGLPPTDPLSGFLPINDSTGIGEGFVDYSISPKANTPTFRTVEAQASIVFDINEPIETNTEENTIDSDEPEAMMVQSIVALDTKRVQLRWTGKDEGSGLKNYDIFVSVNNGPYEVWLKSTSDTVGIYEAQLGNEYCFVALGRDSVNNIKPLPDDCDYSFMFSEDLVHMVDPEKAEVGFFQLYQNYPNPVENGTTTISYQLYERGLIELSIYDVTGKKIKTLINERQEAGLYNVDWPAAGKEGIYFYQLRYNKVMGQTRKMLVFP